MLVFKLDVNILVAWYMAAAVHLSGSVRYRIYKKFKKRK